jgi:PDZ domain-containing secreted protein
LSLNIKELLDAATSLPDLLIKVKEAACEHLPASEKFKVDDIMSSVNGKTHQEIEVIMDDLKKQKNG